VNRYGVKTEPIYHLCLDQLSLHHCQSLTKGKKILQNNELGNEERIHTALFRTTGCNVHNNLLLHNCSLKEKNYNQAKRAGFGSTQLQFGFL